MSWIVSRQSRVGDDVYLIGLHQMVTVDVSALVDVLGLVDAHDQIMRGIDLIFAGI